MAYLENSLVWNRRWIYGMLSFMLFSRLQTQRLNICRGLPDLSQYAAETQKEEYFHQKQWLGLVGIEKGGMQDLFTAQGARFFFGHVASIDDGYVYGDDEEEVRNKSALAMQFVNEFEFMTSNHCYPIAA